MKIVILADGSSIHTEKWIQGLVINGESDIYLISMSAQKTRLGIVECIHDSNVFHLKTKKIKKKGNNYAYIFKIYQAYKLIKKIKPDHISTIYLTSYGFIGSVIKGDTSLSHFLVGTDIMVSPDKSFIHKFITKFALKRAGLLVCASKTIENRVRSFNLNTPLNFLTQQYGVDDVVLNYPVNSKEYDFISNRAWVKNSNILDILSVFKGIKKSFKLAIIGSGGEHEKEILTKINNMNGVERFGVLSYKKNIDLVSKSMFFLSVTSSDGASLSLLEAMSLGAIPIVSNIEPNREWITDGYNGFLIDIKDITKSIDTINSILNLPEKDLSCMGRRNKKIIYEKGNLKNNMSKFIDSISALTSPGK